MKKRNGTMSKISKERKQIIENSDFNIENGWSLVRVNTLNKESPVEEKAYALNYFLNKYYFPLVDNQNSSCISNKGKVRTRQIFTNYNRSRSNALYKHRMIFLGDKESRLASYSSFHSILANLVMDYPKVENENGLITSLRENWQKIREFGMDNTKTELNIKNIDLKYQRYYKEMLRHILVSDKELPSCIKIDSLRKIKEDLTYIIEKKKC